MWKVKHQMNEIINWNSVFAKSQEFQNNSPCKWTFIENFFESSFYEKLYSTYPKSNEDWISVQSDDKSAFRKMWGEKITNDIIKDEDDQHYSEAWNKFHHYLFSEEFLENMRKFSQIPVNRPKHFAFHLMKRGGYQLAHIHNTGPSTLIMMLFFNKDWQKGDPGGTYVTPEEDESKMIFEPYNLNNSVVIFQDGPFAGHGVRYIEKDVERRAIQVYLENYSNVNGWSGDKKSLELREV